MCKCVCGGYVCNESYTPLCAPRSAVQEAVGAITYTQGTTNTGAAIQAAIDMFERVGQRSGAQKISVILTDGGSNNKKDTFQWVLS